VVCHGDRGIAISWQRYSKQTSYNIIALQSMASMASYNIIALHHLLSMANVRKKKNCRHLRSSAKWIAQTIRLNEYACMCFKATCGLPLLETRSMGRGVQLRVALLRSDAG